ncbi:transcriptional regulator PpsR [Methylocapsa palsarum]|uniref:Transcriptional regulator PpsR n=1 Tax=Methylocapsa palsarum TaxID=1612308 RepID=A0A1I4BDW2_9HYPH|nr:transcriptional regulator PpsR [Methylocapsa palsarum]SFK66337.1 transcriptional regulator PpsR [Methylocapsa palsarum]
MAATREPLKDSLGALDAVDSSKLIAAIADVALVMDSKGLIRDVAFGNDVSSEDAIEGWRGRSWIDTVTVESRPKIAEMLRDAAAKNPPRWRHVNHYSSTSGEDLPIRYFAMQVGKNGRVIAVGRDLRAQVKPQQKLMDAQVALERETWRLRAAETRYRLLFEISSEAVLIVDAASLKVVEANPAAVRLAGRSVRRIVGRLFSDLFVSGDAPAIHSLLTAVSVAGQGENVQARLTDGSAECMISASLFRQENSSHFLIRLAPLRAEIREPDLSSTKSALLRMVEKLPDGFVVTDADWRILCSNPAFIDMADLATEEHARALSLDQFVEPDGAAFSVLTSHLREHGSVRNFATTLRSLHGAAESVEITAVAAPDGDQPCFGFTIRRGGRPQAINPAERPTPRSVEQLTELVGRVPLKDLVRESTDIVERLAIKAALELTRDNRASAADMLGVSRQSLYVKMRRHGLGELDG